MDALVSFALKHRVLMVAVFVMMMAGGVFAFRQLNIEAYPDPTPPMVDVITQSEGLSAEEIERYITIPIEAQTSNLKNLRTIRSVSLYGLSDIKLQFTFDYTYEEALQQVLNRLAQLPPLPNGAQPQMRPVLMTCVIAGIGLLPAMLSTGIGSQVQKPLAVVVVCGMMLAPFVILVTLPVLIDMFSRRFVPRAGDDPVPQPLHGGPVL